MGILRRVNSTMPDSAKATPTEGRHHKVHRALPIHRFAHSYLQATLYIVQQVKGPARGPHGAHANFGERRVYPNITIPTCGTSCNRHCNNVFVLPCSLELLMPLLSRPLVSQTVVSPAIVHRAKAHLPCLQSSQSTRQPRRFSQQSIMQSGRDIGPGFGLNNVLQILNNQR